jgi:hypothetical protein
LSFGSAEESIMRLNSSMIAGELLKRFRNLWINIIRNKNLGVPLEDSGQASAMLHFFVVTERSRSALCPPWRVLECNCRCKL